MSFFLTETEWALVQHLPELELVELAAELELVPPAEIDRRTLVVDCVLRIVEVGRSEGLPFSKYDREDLESLSRDELAAIAGLVGTRSSVSAVLSAGQKTYKAWEKTRPKSQVALMLPLLLTAVARASRR
ncbi:MAG: hypothetical protein EP330_03580 [Deltaproteobacteria bacterium]|nr:MAG: hypothetical protein EP330_03580 [Deltaproteobacteria bacterium]